jgi:myo-inositol-1(or 4)-monophosphatase
MNIEKEFQTLITEVEKASVTAREYFESTDFTNEQKSDGSVVTEIDQKIERVIRDFVATYFPEDSIVGEEEASIVGTSSFVWHIDPIDGTDNFLRKIPFCAISIARLGNAPEDSFAIVHNPITGLTFASLMEAGAYENEQLCNLTAEPLGGKYVVGMGRGREEWMKVAGYKIMEAVGLKYGRCMQHGSTALELAYLAAGRLDAFLTFGLNSYDYAAGLYLTQAAGGAISVFEDGAWQRWEGSIKDLCDSHGKTIFASHPDIHDEMRDFIGDPKGWVAGE